MTETNCLVFAVIIFIGAFKDSNRIALIYSLAII